MDTQLQTLQQNITDIDNQLQTLYTQKSTAVQALKDYVNTNYPQLSSTLTRTY